MPTIDLPDDEFDAVIAAIRRVIEDDKFPHAPRLDPLRAALAKLEPAGALSDIQHKAETAQSQPGNFPTSGSFHEGPAVGQSRQAGAVRRGAGA